MEIPLDRTGCFLLDDVLPSIYFPNPSSPLAICVVPLLQIPVWPYQVILQLFLCRFFVCESPLEFNEMQT